MHLELVVEGKRPKRKPKLRWLDKLKADLKEVSAKVRNTQDKVKCRNMIAMPDLARSKRIVSKQQKIQGGPAVMRDKFFFSGIYPALLLGLPFLLHTVSNFCMYDATVGLEQPASLPHSQTPAVFVVGQMFVLLNYLHRNNKL